MFIIPISQAGNIVIPQNIAQVEQQSDSSFESILNNFINEANATDQTSMQDTFNLATSNVDDLHTMTINSAKAELALSFLVQVRNKALDAYNEIMRINL